MLSYKCTQCNTNKKCNNKITSSSSSPIPKPEIDLSSSSSPIPKPEIDLSSSSSSSNNNNNNNNCTKCEAADLGIQMSLRQTKKATSIKCRSNINRISSVT